MFLLNSLEEKLDYLVEKFTIQNVSIKYKIVIKVLDRENNLQYKMFLLNSFKSFI